VGCVNIEGFLDKAVLWDVLILKVVLDKAEVLCTTCSIRWSIPAHSWETQTKYEEIRGHVWWLYIWRL
jgi:hypothetical protein